MINYAAKFIQSCLNQSYLKVFFLLLLFAVLITAGETSPSTERSEIDAPEPVVSETDLVVIRRKCHNKKPSICETHQSDVVG